MSFPTLTVSPAGKPKNRLPAFLLGIAIGAASVAVGFTSSGETPPPVSAPTSCSTPPPAHPAAIDWPVTPPTALNG